MRGLANHYPTPFCKNRSAWGLFDKDGEKDSLGTLNLLTPEVVASAASEIKTGVSVALNWGLEKMHDPGRGRPTLEHKFVNWREKEGFDFYSWDDEITINTQSGEKQKRKNKRNPSQLVG